MPRPIHTHIHTLGHTHTEHSFFILNIHVFNRPNIFSYFKIVHSKYLLDCVCVGSNIHIKHRLLMLSYLIHTLSTLKPSLEPFGHMLPADKERAQLEVEST